MEIKENLVNESISLLRRMVAVPSVTFEETQVCDLIAGFLDERKISFERIGDNILCIHHCGRKNAPLLVLDAHIDTVAAASGYTRDPFDAGNDDEVIYGLGSNDDGGSVAAMLAVYRHLADSKLNFDLALALGAQEERCGVGGSALIYHRIAKEYDKVNLIVGEPTGMKAATAEKGLLVIDGVADGVSGHAARGEGVNALYVALDDISALRSFKFDRHSDILGDTRLSVTQINAGTAHNVIPDKCSFVVDIRPNEKYTNAEILESLQAVCKSELKARRLDNKSSCTAKDGVLMRCVDALGIEKFSSPTTSNWVRLNWDAVKMGPGESSRSHKADEFIRVSEIREAVEKYLEFIEKYNGYTVE